MKLRIWHIPQVPGTAFRVEVSSVDEAILIINTLANYDGFQFQENVKPDYTNMSGLEVYSTDFGDWVEWEDDDGLYISDLIEARWNQDRGKFSTSKSAEMVTP